jgi:bis(5'-nucleosyl)-tetraphosphatase (symmetrical)
MATYAIGDLQGCYDPLMRLLEKLNFNPTDDTLWFAGDLVNRGKQSLETLRLIRSLGNAAISVLGNHDISLLAAFHGLRKPHKSLKKLVEAPDYPELIQWLAHCPIMHTDLSLGYTLVHAGIPPQWNLAMAEQYAREIEQELVKPDRSTWLSQVYGDQPDYWSLQHPRMDKHRYILNAFTRMRYCRVDGSFDFDAKGNPAEKDELTDASVKLIPWFAYPNRQPLGVTVLFGHWSTLGYYDGNQVIALDTGCVWGGQLSAIRIDTNKPQLICIECDDYG